MQISSGLCVEGQVGRETFNLDIELNILGMLFPF
jgi:hypothetical protein